MNISIIAVLLPLLIVALIIAIVYRKMAERKGSVGQLHTINTTPTDPLCYAGFWPRLGALLLDLLIILPITALTFWGDAHYRLFMLYYLVPGTLFGLFYSVYLVRRFGGTPGKLIVGVRIRKVNGDPAGYREAVLRYFPEFIFGLLMSIAMVYSLFHMSDAEYHAIPFLKRATRMAELAPSWFKPLEIVQNVWVWSEMIVLLTNRKRRALHDFIAGTVVVHKSPNKSLQPTAVVASGELTKKDTKRNETIGVAPPNCTYEERIKYYSLADLDNVKQSIDKRRFPDRYQLVIQEIEKRMKQ